MLQYETAKKLYEEIKAKATSDTRPGFDDFYNGFLKSAASYAETRTSGTLWNCPSEWKEIVVEASNTTPICPILELYAETLESKALTK